MAPALALPLAILPLLAPVQPQEVAPSGSRQVVYVVPTAAEGGDGSRARPFLELAQARDALRELPGRGGEIVLLPGIYPLRESFQLDQRDDGLTLRGSDEGEAYLIGGVSQRTPRLLPVADEAMRARLPSDAARAAVRVLEIPPGVPLTDPVHRGMGTPVVPVGTELIADGLVLRRARWPNDGFATIGELLDPGSVPRNRAEDVPEAERETGPERGGVFRLDPERLQRWRGADQAWVLGYWFHDWADEQLPVAAIDADAGTVELGLPHRYGLKAGAPFYALNLLEELDAPGEFFLDLEGRRLYLWPPRERIEELLLTTLDGPMLQLKGARDLRLEGLTLRATRGAAVVVEDCEGVVLTDLRIEQTGTHGIDIRGGRANMVSACRLESIGAAGIKASAGDRATLTPGGHRVLGNDITDFGRLYRTYQPGIALGGVGQVATGNRIAHAPHSGIIFGGNEHLIAGNEIYDVLRETGDCGAIYCGRDWAMHGTVIRDNFIHHLRGVEGRWQNAIYLDDMASGIEVRDNLIWRSHWGMLIGGGRDLVIEGNVFVECELGIRFDARGVGWMAKHIADPATSTLHRRLAAVPVDQPPWSERYPTVQRTLSDRFGRPAGSRVTDNAFLATPEGSVADREAVAVSGSVVDPQEPAWLREDREDPYRARFPATAGPLRPRSSLPGSQLVLAAGGRSDWRIELHDPADADQRATGERLAGFLERISGARIPVRGPDRGPDRNRIRLEILEPGSSPLHQTREDGFQIISDGDDLLIYSASADGLDYAVTALLEHFGCRLWAPGALHVPQIAALHLPKDFSLRASPPVWFRHVNYAPANDPEYRRWHKLDRIQEEVGRLWAPWWVHSVLRHLPPEEHFEEHPEWYALVGGERRPSQLCLTNPEVLEAMIASIEEMLEEHPGVKYISVSQADNYEHCQCPEARTINAREESAMGETLQFVNAIADAFPDRIISTLAYQYTRKPPKELRPRPNVSIMLCTIEEDRARPIPQQGPPGSFAADFAGWSAICDDIFLWDYQVQFASPVAPFPNLRVLQPNVKWFADNGVCHLFLQGNGLRTEMAELRCYLLAKLAWDADLNVEATIDEFLIGYYGAAAQHLRAYLDLLHAEMEASGEPLLIYGNPALAKDSWLRPQVMAQAAAHLAAAERAVSGDPALQGRVRTARLPLMYAELEIAKRRGARPGGVFERHPDHGAWRVRPRIPELLRAFLDGAAAAGIGRLREMDLSLAEYRAAWQPLLDPSRLEAPSFGAAVRATPPPSAKYADGVAARLSDGMPGGDQYHENWVGWEGTDAWITVDLGAVAPRGTFQFSALQDPKSWVWLPRAIRVEHSRDGEDWREHATLKHGQSDREPRVHRYTGDFQGAAFRYLRLVVDAGEQCPDGHLGAGGPSWFFLDEIEVR